MKFLPIAILSLIPPLQSFPIHPHPFTTRPLPQQTSTKLSLLKGLVPSVDDDINTEILEASLSTYDLFRRELSRTNSLPSAFAVIMKRQQDASGDYENKYKILTDNRSYSDRILLDKDHVGEAPSLTDLNQKQPRWSKVLWSRSYFRLGVFLSAFAIFPYACALLNTLVQINPDEFDIINEQFTPGIGILYGTFVALTLDILYERQGKVQENASVEASLLSLTTQNILSLFRQEEKIAREATQIIADQVRIIVYRSRGAEMLNIMRSDPYARLMSLVDRYQRSKTSFTPAEEALIDGLRGEIPMLMEARATRLSGEASALPPTHFLVLTLLTALSLIGFTAATVSITPNGPPPLEARMVFAGLTAIYVLFFNFSNDMNDPFDGVYQIKRSSAASYLLQIKWLVANQPWGEDIRFDTRGVVTPEFDGDVLEVVGEKNGALEGTMRKMEIVEEAVREGNVGALEAEKERVDSTVDAKVLVSGAVLEPEKVVVNGSRETSDLLSSDSEANDFKIPSTLASTSMETESDIQTDISTPQQDKLDVNGSSHDIKVLPTAALEQKTTDSSSTLVKSPKKIESIDKAAPSRISLPDDSEQDTDVLNDSNEPSLIVDASSHVEQEAESIETPPVDSFEISLEPENSEAYSSIQVNGSQESLPKELGSIKDFIPNYFRSQGGFSEEGKTNTDSSLVMVPTSSPANTVSTVANSRQMKASAYFRNMGGFLQ